MVNPSKVPTSSSPMQKNTISCAFNWEMCSDARGEFRGLLGKKVTLDFSLIPALCLGSIHNSHLGERKREGLWFPSHWSICRVASLSLSRCCLQQFWGGFWFEKQIPSFSYLEDQVQAKPRFSIRSVLPYESSSWKMLMCHKADLSACFHFSVVSVL